VRETLEKLSSLVKDLEDDVFEIKKNLKSEDFKIKSRMKIVMTIMEECIVKMSIILHDATEMEDKRVGKICTSCMHMPPLNSPVELTGDKAYWICPVCHNTNKVMKKG